jgi:hypothetical protein
MPGPMPVVETEPQRARRPDQAGSIRRAAISPSPLHKVPSIVHDVIRSPGQPLDQATRAWLKSKVNHDLSGVPVHADADVAGSGQLLNKPGDPFEREANQFADRVARNGTAIRDPLPLDVSRVRIHTDEKAAQAAQSLDARAYTVGSSIVFGRGQYAAGDPSGRWLLAHELVHVAQQQGPASTSPPIQRVGIFESISRFIGGGTFSDEELQNYLAGLQRTQRIEDRYDSDNKAREVVCRWKGGQAAFRVLTVPIRTLLIQEMASGYLSGDDQNGILDLLSDSIPSELNYILPRINIDTLKTRFDGNSRRRLNALLENQETDALGLGNAWTAQGVMQVLNRHGDDRIIRTIVDQGYRIIRFQTAYDRWRYDDGREEEEELRGLRGNTLRAPTKEIRLRGSMTNEQAASTLFHEVSHVLSVETDFLEQEIQVRVETEQFLMRHGLPPTGPQYRRPNATVNEPFIRSEITSSPHYNPTGRERVGRRYVGEAPITGWAVL